jgi:hypothetical protein
MPKRLIVHGSSQLPAHSPATVRGTLFRFTPHGVIHMLSHALTWVGGWLKLAFLCVARLCKGHRPTLHQQILRLLFFFSFCHADLTLQGDTAIPPHRLTIITALPRFQPGAATAAAPHCTTLFLSLQAHCRVCSHKLPSCRLCRLQQSQEGCCW